MVYLNLHTEELDIGRALDKVSAGRRETALRYVRESDRRLSLAVYLLLQEALEKEYGITAAPQFGFAPHGKPFLKDYPHIHFNLSHCRGAALCVVSDSPVGCDIENVPDIPDMDICRQCFNDEETERIMQAPDPAFAFISLWTRKEAFLKMTGEGLTRDLPALLLSPRAATARFETVILPDTSLVYTICRP